MLREQKLTFVLVTALMAIVALMEGVIITLLVPMLNLVMGEGSTAQGILGSVGIILENILSFFHIKLSLTVVLILFVTAFIVQGLFRLLQMHVQMKMLTKYEFSLINRVFGSYFSSSWPFFLRSRAGQLLNILSTETNRATTAFQAACDFVASFLIAVLYVTLSILISWEIALVGVVLCSAASISLKKFMRRAQTYGTAISDINNELQAYASDKITAAKMLKSSATEKRAVEDINILTKRKVHLRYLSMMNSAVIPSIYQPLIIAILCLILYFAIVHWHMNFGTMLIFFYIFYRLIPYFSNLQYSYQQALIFMPGLKEIDKIVETAKSMQEIGGDKKIQHLNKAIIFDNVSFAYQNSLFVLNNINMEIKKGEFVAIVGESGVGKSTLVDLLLALFSPTKGQIMIDDALLSNYDLTSWRKLIGYLSQDTFLFHDTIQANLKWMVPDASDEQVKAAAKAAYADEFIMKTPQKYDTIVGDRGAKLSGGQRQRLALARVILQDPEIIILDEATSALDSESEAMIQQSIDEFSVNKTIIAISHRPSMVRKADRVYVLEKGSIIEVGKWDELTSRGIEKSKSFTI